MRLLQPDYAPAVDFGELAAVVFIGQCDVRILFLFFFFFYYYPMHRAFRIEGGLALC
jgi:hypothetical protein